MNVLYTGALYRIMRGEMVMHTADLRALLLDAAGTYILDREHDFVGDLDPEANELDTIGYERKTLAGVDVIRNAGLHRVEVVASNLVYVDLGDGEDPYPSVQALVIYEHDPDDSAARLVAWIDEVAGATNGETATVAFSGGIGINLGGAA